MADQRVLIEGDVKVKQDSKKVWIVYWVFFKLYS
jgi:hypothetical protein